MAQSLGIDLIEIPKLCKMRDITIICDEFEAEPEPRKHVISVYNANLES